MRNILQTAPLQQALQQEVQGRAPAIPRRRAGDLARSDLSWDALRTFGRIVVFERTRPEQVVERAAGAEIAFTNKTPMPGSLLAQLPALRYIGVLATGYNILDVNAAKARGIVVTNIPTYGTASVAQLVFALRLHLQSLGSSTASHATHRRPTPA